MSFRQTTYFNVTQGLSRVEAALQNGVCTGIVIAKVVYRQYSIEHPVHVSVADFTVANCVYA